MLSRDHILAVEQVVPLERSAVFAFFSEAENLEHITPHSLRFEIVSKPGIEIAEGAIIDYRLRLFGIPFTWRSRISRWEPGNCFVDEQEHGPYAQWIHTHTFYDVEGGTLIRDVVHYRLPFYPLGEMIHPLVRRQLKEIFAFRQARIKELLVEERRRQEV